tara:strand:- start:1146 stop:1292 length:147 start_codon:yes stop_codon:yes gene_type:complete
MGIPEFFVIVCIFLVIFGGRQLPKLARGIGSAIADFRDESNRKDTPDV